MMFASPVLVLAPTTMLVVVFMSGTEARIAIAPLDTIRDIAPLISTSERYSTLKMSLKRGPQVMPVWEVLRSKV